MLTNNPFYYQLDRKHVTIFGNMFNNITLVRRNLSDSTEIERVKVPIVYGPRDKYLPRSESDPDLNREVQIILPRMAFNLTGRTYDVMRKQNSLLRAARANTSTHVAAQYMGVPYDLNFDLYIYSKTIDEANQILEQILPYFNPDYTVSVNPVPDVGFIKDIPIILNSVSDEIDYDGDYENVRHVLYTLNFTMKTYYWGPITTPKIIRKVITNIYNDPSLQAGNVIRINTSGGNNGMYKLDDIVYQGPTYDKANAYGIVYAWQPNTGKIVITGAQGQFKVNNQIRSLSTNAVYTIDSFDASPLKLAKIVIEPDPIDALPNSDFGYTTTVTEWPLTE